ncbi:hypothetical protein D1007_27835 [Hordeum vulgare]|nr:hypothetical protein D1007_27835 [Hordeum vulgare]
MHDVGARCLSSPNSGTVDSSLPRRPLAPEISPPMWPPTDGLQPVPESLTQLLLRIRLGKIPDQREPKRGRVCSLEKAMRSYVDRKSGQVVAPEIAREFDSLAEAFKFYNLYSWEIGFGIRYGQSRTNAHKSRTVQDIVCGCSVSTFYLVYLFVVIISSV